MRTYTDEEINLIKEGIKNRIPKHIIVKSNFQSKFQEFNENLRNLKIDYPRFSTKNNRIIKNNPFENLDNPEVQYWLGWLATDGYVTLNGNRIALSLSVKDIDVLEKFKNFLNNDRLKLKYDTHHGKFEMVKLSFRSLDILYFLYSDKVGFCENKTFEFYPKFKITKDYIRGVFEGDGYVRWYNLGASTNEFSIVSACREHATVLNNWFHDNGFDTKIVEKQKGHKNVMYYIELYKKKQIQDLMNLIYEDAHVFMNRKYDIALAIRNDGVESPKVGEPASGIPSQAANSAEGVTT